MVIRRHVASGDDDRDEGCWENTVLLGFGFSIVEEVTAALVPLLRKHKKTSLDRVRIVRGHSLSST